jgi:hypothetical protein
LGGSISLVIISPTTPGSSLSSSSSSTTPGTALESGERFRARSGEHVVVVDVCDSCTASTLAADAETAAIKRRLRRYCCGGCVLTVDLLSLIIVKRPEFGTDGCSTMTLDIDTEVVLVSSLFLTPVCVVQCDKNDPSSAVMEEGLLYMRASLFIQDSIALKSR